jgi:hypothetical protein
MSDEIKCSKCGGNMVAGFEVDRGIFEIDMRQAKWVQVVGDYFEKYGFFQKKHIKEARTITTYRCVQCGFLESYASMETCK